MKSKYSQQIMTSLNDHKNLDRKARVVKRKGTEFSWFINRSLLGASVDKSVLKERETAAREMMTQKELPDI